MAHHNYNYTFSALTQMSGNWLVQSISESKPTNQINQAQVWPIILNQGNGWINIDGMKY